jgi:hypothetical protein
MAGGCGHGRCREVPNEEVFYHERSVQDVMIKDLQRQVGISIKFQYFKVILCLLLLGE